MAAPLNQVFFPSSFSGLFSAWSRFPDAVPYAGGTGLVRDQGRQILQLPQIIMSLDKLEDLHRISRSERYLEIGAMVRLNQVIRLGKIVPEALVRCLGQIAGVQVRNIATIGGNICCPTALLDAAVVLTALDARYELRGAQSSRWISASRFSALPGAAALNPQELLTRVRVPLGEWNYSVYKKFAGKGPEDGGTAAVFLIKNQKNVLSDIRVIYKTDAIVRDKNSEVILAGKQLPLSRRIAQEFMDSREAFLSGMQNLDELSRMELLNCIESHVYNLTE